MSLDAFDRAAAQILEQDFTTGVEQNANVVMRDGAAKLRVLFMDELALLKEDE